MTDNQPSSLLSEIARHGFLPPEEIAEMREMGLDSTDETDRKTYFEIQAAAKMPVEKETNLRGAGVDHTIATKVVASAKKTL